MKLITAIIRPDRLDAVKTALFEIEVPVIGTMKATSALPFDVGVYFVVIGVVLMVVEAFGEQFTEVDRSPESNR